MRDILGISQELFSAWEGEDVRYSHWKSNEHLYEGLVGITDLDVLIDPEDRERAETVLRSLRFLQFRPQYGSDYPMVDDWIGCDTGTGRLIHIHLHYRIITGHMGMKEYALPWTREVLNTRVRHEEFPVYVTDPSLEMLLLLSRIALKSTMLRRLRAAAGKFSLSLGDKKEIAYLKELYDEDRFLSFADSIYGDDSKDMYKLSRADKYDADWFRRLYALVRKHLSFCDTRKPFSLLIRIYYFFVLRLRFVLKRFAHVTLITRKTPPKGCVIAFIGQDGAGKSTVSKEIVSWLKWKIDATKYYLGSGEHYFSIQKLIRSRLHSKSGLVGSIRNLLTVSDLQNIASVTKRKVKRAEKYAQKGGIAVFDRFPQVQFAGINDGPKIRSGSDKRNLGKAARMIINHCAVREERYLKSAAEQYPDLVFKLILSPEESIRRKPEENLENVRQKHDVIKRMTFGDAKVIEIDAQQDYSEEIRFIHCAIWDYLVDGK